MSLTEIVLLAALGLALAFVIHEGLCRSRGEMLQVTNEDLAQARIMLWMMIGGMVLVGGSLLVQPGLLSMLLLLIIGLLATGWSLRQRRMIPGDKEE